MIKTPLSTVIGGAFWTPGATVIGGQQSFDQLVKKLFANNEQGFFYDPNDLSTMFKDAAGTVPITGAGQPVMLMLDKSNGLKLGGELIVNGDFTKPFAWGVNTPGVTTAIVEDNAQYGKQLHVSTTASSNGGVSTVYVINGQYLNVTGKVLRIEFKVKVTKGTLYAGIIGRRLGTYGITSNFIHVVRDAYMPVDATLRFYAEGEAEFYLADVSAKEVQGNHAYQTTSSMRPLLAATPQRIDFDTVDDKLITNLPAQLTGCTVVRSVPNVGTQILTGQTIPATYNDNTDHCGLIVINRALTPNETSAITAEFNKRAGV